MRDTQGTPSVLTWRTNPPEIPDGRDNDCVGDVGWPSPHAFFVDEVAIEPTGEVCDNRDNDGDGEADNDIPEHRAIIQSLE